MGITSNLVKRVFEHKNNVGSRFTKAYKVHKLVHYETTDDAISAITREKQLKKWKRAWKLNLIETQNPEWRDLYPDLL